MSHFSISKSEKVIKYLIDTIKAGQNMRTKW